jgi:7-cyano-7-deazaguanine tRNA-ribosyltransferase
VGRTQVEKDVELSLERARLSAPIKGKMMMAGTVQGGTFPDLRAHSAQALAKMDFDVHPIGGVVPLMERYRYADIVRATLAAKPHIPANRPIHLFGCGHPMFFAQATFLGCDLFDSASYAKFAEAGRMMLPTGTIHLEETTELPCTCPVCSHFTAEELKGLPKPERDLELMSHNLHVAAAEMRAVRQAILENKLFEMVAQRARNHPSLLEALEATLEYSSLLEKQDLVGKTSSIFYTGPETLTRPEIARFHERLIERYPYRKTLDIVLIPDDARRPFADTAGTVIQEIRRCRPSDVILLFLTPMGVVPWELEHVHPAQQCVFPERLDCRTLASVESRLYEALRRIEHERLVWFQRKTSLDPLVEKIESLNAKKVDTATALLDELERHGQVDAHWTTRKLHAVLAAQWGEGASHVTSLEGLDVDISRATGKIRHVRQESLMLFTVVPTTGLLTPTYDGGMRLLDAGIDARYVVHIDSEVAEFVADGKSALAKFVRQASPDLRAGEEVLVCDEDSNLLGVGRALLTGPEMLDFDRGVAVNIRHSRKDQAGSSGSADSA